MGSLEVVTGENGQHWDGIVKSFPNWDVYYLNAYMAAMERHGDGEPLLLNYIGEKSRMCYCVHKRDIAKAEAFCGLVAENTLYDLTTPYGYGGPLSEGEFDREEQESFSQLFLDYCRKEKVVTQFLKFHPFYQNQKNYRYVGEIQHIKHTIEIDTSNAEVILANMDPKNRNVIRKAQRSGCEIFFDNGENIDAFIKLYEITMNRLEAKPYYYFSREYYDYLLTNMKDNVVVFYCKKENEIIAAAMFFYNEQYMHYHLSGTLPEFRKYAPTNLLLYEAALWGCEKGITRLHLGGGVGVSDSLFGFKKQFNRNGYLPFWIGRSIVDIQAYERLLDIRCAQNKDFNRNNDYYIQYRA